jgi:hypothetical protein
VQGVDFVVWEDEMNHYQKCPICEGRGIVPKGFYETLGKLSKKESEQCKLCTGQGAILIVDIVWQTITTGPAIVPHTEPFTIPFDPPSPFPGTTWIGGSCDTSVSVEGVKDYIHMN